MIQDFQGQIGKKEGEKVGVASEQIQEKEQKQQKEFVEKEIQVVIKQPNERQAEGNIKQQKSFLKPYENKDK